MEERTKEVRQSAPRTVPKKPPAAATAAAFLRQHEKGKEPGSAPETRSSMGLEVPRAPEERPSCRRHRGPPMASAGRLEEEAASLGNTSRCSVWRPRKVSQGSTDSIQIYHGEHHQRRQRDKRRGESAGKANDRHCRGERSRKEVGTTLKSQRVESGNVLGGHGPWDWRSRVFPRRGPPVAAIETNQWRLQEDWKKRQPRGVIPRGPLRGGPERSAHDPHRKPQGGLCGGPKGQPRNHRPHPNQPCRTRSREAK